MKKSPISMIYDKVKGVFTQEKVAWIEATEVEFRIADLMPIMKHLEELANVRDRVMAEFVEYNTKVINGFVMQTNKEVEGKIPAEYQAYKDEIEVIKNDYKKVEVGYVTFKGGVKKKVKESFVNGLLKEVETKHLEVVTKTNEIMAEFKNKLATETVKLKVFVMPRMAFPQQMSANDVRKLGKLVEELKIE